MGDFLTGRKTYKLSLQGESRSNSVRKQCLFFVIVFRRSIFYNLFEFTGMWVLGLKKSHLVPVRVCAS